MFLNPMFSFTAYSARQAYDDRSALTNFICSLLPLLLLKPFEALVFPISMFRISCSNWLETFLHRLWALEESLNKKWKALNALLKSKQWSRISWEPSGILISIWKLIRTKTDQDHLQWASTYLWQEGFYAECKEWRSWGDGNTSFSRRDICKGSKENLWRGKNYRLRTLVRINRISSFLVWPTVNENILQAVLVVLQYEHLAEACKDVNYSRFAAIGVDGGNNHWPRCLEVQSKQPFG